ncbi:hypothetical protein FUA24_21235 [Seonamhaeicola marinus]|uniref:Uncharacterized protein n=2 Tax=Seonamhaeicola marinus TaxID=1912246 RepID=A0A5D0HEX3_9FLAO|nr:hypothetical protein FUA24_21235 [Seonamhaeicola marinus]
MRFIFPFLYVFANLIVIPPLAKSLGREALPVFTSNLKPKHLVYPMLFRNYVNPDLYFLLVKSSQELQLKNIELTYLDANFPFFDNFPLLPHLSHNDGKKVDISFMYLDNDGNSTTKKPSISGYGSFVKEHSTTSETCRSNGNWQYNFTKYLTFGKTDDLVFDAEGTTLIIKQLLHSPKTEKIFLEPYLKKSLGLSSEDRIRFHGCKSVRHDDHIHLQIK